MKRVLVTGPSGFIGGHLIERLTARGDHIDAMVHQRPERSKWGPEITVIEGDLCVKRGLDRLAGDYDVVFHLAGCVHAVSDGAGSENLYQAVNVDGTRRVLEFAEASRVRGIVFFSSVKAMGEGSLGCLDESIEPRPKTPYGRSKLAAERLVFDLGKRTGIQVVCLRFPMVYGPGNKGNLSRMISAIDRGRFPPLPDTGNRRSMVHVSNVVDAAILAATHPTANGQCYIVADQRPYSTREIYESICRGLGKPIPRWHLPLGALTTLARVGDAIGRVRGRRVGFDSDALEKLTGSAWYRSDKITRELGFRPRVTFEDALPELVAWYRGGASSDLRDG